MSEPIPFLAFACVVIGLFYGLKAPLWRRSVETAANVVFLVSFFGSPQSAIPLTAFLVASYLSLRLVQWRPRTWFGPALIGTIVAFVWLKKYAFIPPALFLPFDYVTVGLSYILFRVLHLTIDSWSGAIPETVGIVPFFNYTCGFTTLASGPIQQYRDWLNTADPVNRPPLMLSGAIPAVERIVRGLFKTNVLALLLSTLHGRDVDFVLSAQPAAAKIVPAATMFVLYPLFIYCNFSGYIDIVIGAGNLLGMTLPENFNRPFASDNIMEFWGNRWHITLSHWLRAYVYNPMLVTTMRRFTSAAIEPFLAVSAFFVTFFLIGVWHGRTTEFIFYGFVLGLGVSVNKIWQIVLTKRMGRKGYNALARNYLYIAVSRGLTFTWVCFTTIWFWSDWHQIDSFKTALSSSQMTEVWLLIFAGSAAVLALWEEVRGRLVATLEAEDPVYSHCVRAAFSAASILVTVAAGVLMQQTAPGIVYKAF